MHTSIARECVLSKPKPITRQPRLATPCTKPRRSGIRNAPSTLGAASEAMVALPTPQRKAAGAVEGAAAEPPPRRRQAAAGKAPRSARAAVAATKAAAISRTMAPQVAWPGW